MRRCRHPRNGHQVNLPDQDLAYLKEGTRHYDDYVEAVGWAQKFARINRDVMMHNLVAAVRTVIAKPFDAHVEAVDCHHNYVQKEQHFGREVLVTRKGAVSARAEAKRRKDPGVIDEIPLAYKDIDAVMQAQRDLVEGVHTLRQVVCVKG